MELLKKKSVTPGTRHMVNIDKSVLLKTDKIFKSLFSYKYKNGRSSATGHITSWHRGAGCKRMFRDVASNGLNRFSLVIGISYDPNRSAFISNNFDFNNKKFFNAISSMNLVSGTLVKQIEDFNSIDSNLFSKNKQIMLGYRTKIKNMPVGSIINSISLGKNKKIAYIKSAGCQGQVVRIDKKTANVKLSTGAIVVISNEAIANVGTVSNDQHELIVYGKAGKKRLLNRRPIVRGIAMNPVDHPHGGRTNAGRLPCSPWGILTKGKFKLKKRKSPNRLKVIKNE